MSNLKIVLDAIKEGECAQREWAEDHPRHYPIYNDEEDCINYNDDEDCINYIGNKYECEDDFETNEKVYPNVRLPNAPINYIIDVEDGKPFFFDNECNMINYDNYGKAYCYDANGTKCVYNSNGERVPLNINKTANDESIASDGDNENACNAELIENDGYLYH